MKLIKLISLSRHHANLCDKVGWYSKWHEHPYHKHVHWLTFSIFVLISGIVVYNSYVLKPGLIRADKHDEKMVIELADKEEKAEKQKEEKQENEKDGKEKINENVEICHKPLGTNPVTITISQSALQAHLDHGDTVGKCAEAESTSPQPSPYQGEGEENEEPPVVPSPAEENEEPPIEEPAVIPTIPASSDGGGGGSAIPVFGTATVLDVTSPIRNNKYRTGPMPIYVIFSKPVEVIGSPVLAIATGNPSETLIDYREGSGTDTLAFTYKIASTNFSSDLDYSSINSLSLNGGSIKDTDGNDASILLPVPGSAHSLSANKNITIDTTIRKPTVLAPPVL